MNVVFAVCWNIEIDDYVHMWNVEASATENTPLSICASTIRYTVNTLNTQRKIMY